MFLPKPTPHFSTLSSPNSLPSHGLHIMTFLELCFSNQTRDSPTRLTNSSSSQIKLIHIKHVYELIHLWTRSRASRLRREREQAEYELLLREQIYVYSHLLQASSFSLVPLPTIESLQKLICIRALLCTLYFDASMSGRIRLDITGTCLLF